MIFPKLYQPEKSQPTLRRLFSFSRPWPCAYFLNGTNAAASIAPALIGHCWSRVQPSLVTSTRRRGVVASGVRRMNEVNPRRARLVPWMGDHLRAGIPSLYVTSQLGHLSLASLRVPASAGVRAGMSALSGGR